MVIGWVILSMVVIGFLGHTLHSSDRPTHVKTAGFLRLSLGWLLLSAITAVLLNEIGLL